MPSDSPNRQALCCEPLEDRLAPALTFGIGGSLSITATADDDVRLESVNFFGSARVEVNGSLLDRTTGTFIDDFLSNQEKADRAVKLDDLSSITVTGRGEFRNEFRVFPEFTIPITLDGGPGDDSLGNIFRGGVAPIPNSLVVIGGPGDDMVGGGVGDDTILGGEGDVPCPGGIEAMMLRIQEGGWTSLIPSVRGAMLSTEQMLHPTKDGVDFPANVALPRWPTEAGEASLKYETTLGELAIYRLMRERGLDERSARFASIGWDGDRLRIYELPTGEKVTLWRSTWDREDDATQFVTGVSPLSGSALGFRVTRRGRVVDCISAEQDELAELLRKAMDEFVGEPQPQEADAQTTTASETELARGG